MSFDITPRQPQRPLIWSDAVLDLQELLLEDSASIYVVGGAVRDAYLHRPINDLDLVTPSGAVKLGKRIANVLQGDVFVLDDERDVARVLLETPDGKLIIDIASFRGEDLLHDLRDRDFTINAMAVDLKADLSQLIDPLGGEQDALHKQLRRCSPDSIATDPIRALRAVRQSMQLGFRIEPQTLQEVRTYAADIRQTSAERVRDEFLKLLDLPRTSGALRIAEKLGLVQVILPEIAPLRDHTLWVMDKLNLLLSAVSFARTDSTAATFELGMIVMQFDVYRRQLNTHLSTIWANDRTHHALLMLAGLLHDVDNDQIGETAADALRLSNAEKQRLVAVLQNDRHPAFEAAVTPLIAHRYWHKLGEAGVDAIFLALARHLGSGLLNQDAWLVLVERMGVLLDAYYHHYDEIVAPPPLLDGTQLIKLLNLKPSPIIGELLTLIREGQAEGRFTSIDEALNAAQKYLQT